MTILNTEHNTCNLNNSDSIPNQHTTTDMLHIPYNLAAYHLSSCCLTPFAVGLRNVSGFAISVGSVGKVVRGSIIFKDNTLLS